MRLQVTHIITEYQLKAFMKARNIKSIKEAKKQLRAYFEAVSEGVFYDEFNTN